MNEFKLSREEWLRMLDTVDRLLNVTGALNDELAEARLKIQRLEKMAQDTENRLAPVRIHFDH